MQAAGDSSHEGRSKWLKLSLWLWAGDRVMVPVHASRASIVNLPSGTKGRSTQSFLSACPDMEQWRRGRESESCQQSHARNAAHLSAREGAEWVDHSPATGFRKMAQVMPLSCSSLSSSAQTRVTRQESPSGADMPPATEQHLFHSLHPTESTQTKAQHSPVNNNQPQFTRSQITCWCESKGLRVPSCMWLCEPFSSPVFERTSPELAASHKMH